MYYAILSPSGARCTRDGAVMSIKDAPRAVGRWSGCRPPRGFCCSMPSFSRAEASPAVADGFCRSLAAMDGGKGGLQAPGDEALAFAKLARRGTKGARRISRDLASPGRAERFDLAVGPIGDLPGRAVLLEVPASAGLRARGGCRRARGPAPMSCATRSQGCGVRLSSWPA